MGRAIFEEKENFRMTKETVRKPSVSQVRKIKGNLPPKSSGKEPQNIKDQENTLKSRLALKE